jgi:hypothetical protein
MHCWAHHLKSRNLEVQCLPCEALQAASDVDDDGADHSRLKRFKKAYKMLNSLSARRAINTLKVHPGCMQLQCCCYMHCAPGSGVCQACVQQIATLNYLLSTAEAAA